MSTASDTEAGHSMKLVAHDARISALEGTLSLFRRETDDMKQTINETKAAVEEIGRDTKEMVFIFGEAKAAFRLFNRLAWVLRASLRFVVLPALALWLVVSTITHGTPPTWLVQLFKAFE